MRIKLATEKDAKAISSLILKTATVQLRNEFSDDGWILFIKLINEDTQKSLIKNKKFNYLIAVEENDAIKVDSEIIGVLVTKDVNHIFHLFINPSWQGKGLGTKLWQKAMVEIHDGLKKKLTKAQNDNDTVSVNSSDFALSFYQHLGFCMESGRQIKNGICYTPMRFTFA